MSHAESMRLLDSSRTAIILLVFTAATIAAAEDDGVYVRFRLIKPADVVHQREQQNGPVARRIFYYTSRFRQHAATQRVRWHTESFHKHFDATTAVTSPPRVLTSTLVADHPYFAGSGLGMGMVANPAWSGHPLAMD